MTAFRDYQKWLQSQGIELDADDHWVPRTLVDLDKAFPDHPEVYLFQPPGRTSSLRVVFTPSNESPYVFETFASGYDHVDVYHKRIVSVPSFSCSPYWCGRFVLPESWAGYMHTAYTSNGFTASDFNNPERVRELVANHLKRKVVWDLEVKAAGTARPFCALL